MTKQEIIDNNKLIAEFTSFDYSKLNTIPGWLKDYQEDELNYHKSWYWLMPVVEKIENMKLGDLDLDGDIFFNCCPYIELIGHYCNIGFQADMRLYDNHIEVHGDSKLDATYKAVIKFIKWYYRDK